MNGREARATALYPNRAITGRVLKKRDRICDYIRLKCNNTYYYVTKAVSSTVASRPRTARQTRWEAATEAAGAGSYGHRSN